MFIHRFFYRLVFVFVLAVPLSGEDLSYLTGRFDPSTDPRFVEVPAKYSLGGPYYLRKEACAALTAMIESARKDHVKLFVVSATRNFNSQKRIWEGKWSGSTKVEGKDLSRTLSDPLKRAEKILEYSSMPGTSRHHWGTDVDLNSVFKVYFNKPEGKKALDWLSKNAVAFGFARPYTAKGADRPSGYSEEKWHWSYTPLSIPLLKEYSGKIKDSDLNGFSGSETAFQLQIVEKYVMGVSRECGE